MASTMALCREGHLIAVFHMFLFAKSKHIVVAVFDLTDPETDQTQFPTEDWSVAPCGPCKEDAPSIASTTRGICFTMRAFVDSDHSSDSVDRISGTRF